MLQSFLKYWVREGGCKYCCQSFFSRVYFPNERERDIVLRRTLQMLDLSSLKSRHYNVVACSAITGSGLPKAIDWMVADVRSRIYMLED